MRTKFIVLEESFISEHFNEMIKYFTDAEDYCLAFMLKSHSFEQVEAELKKMFIEVDLEFPKDPITITELNQDKLIKQSIISIDMPAVIDPHDISFGDNVAVYAS